MVNTDLRRLSFGHLADHCFSSISLLLIRRGLRAEKYLSLIVNRLQKKSPTSLLDEIGLIPGDDLLSQGLSPHYHRRYSVSLPGSEWDRVVPLCSGHQKEGFESARLDHFLLRAGFLSGYAA